MVCGADAVQEEDNDKIVGGAQGGGQRAESSGRIECLEERIASDRWAVIEDCFGPLGGN